MSIPTNLTRRTIPHRLSCIFLAVSGFLAQQAFGEEPKVVSGLKNPESVVVGPGGKIYVSMVGEVGKEADGSIAIVDPSGKITPFVTGLDDPKGLVALGDNLYVADVKKVWKVNSIGKTEVFAAPEAFPRPPMSLERPCL